MREDLYEMIRDITRLGNRAVRRAQEDNRRNNVPNVYVLKGTMIFELPDGTLTFGNPFAENAQDS
jgi:hypothetical protein